jgi:hypothetical protein
VTDILSCPLCQTRDPLVMNLREGEEVGHWVVTCRECKLSLPGHPTEESALKRWNTRRHVVGLNKLTEEIGELGQVIGKIGAFPDAEEHPDGKGHLRIRLEDEIADVQAACQHVIEENNLNKLAIGRRRTIKLAKFKKWMTI